MTATPVYDRIGQGYDSHRRADPGIGDALYRLLCPAPDGQYLDLACGSGNYTVALAERGLSLTGIDPSRTMLAAAAAKSGAVRWRKGAAEALPFEDAAFDGALCTLAIHHFDDIGAAFAGVRRVLKPGGRFVLFTGEAGQMRRYWLNRYFPQAMRRATRRMPAEAAIRASLAKAGFARVETEPFFVTEALLDQFLYSGKARPEIYLDPAVRAGISTFANLADDAELAAGLARLSRDIDSGAIAEVIAAHASPAGDYLFVAAR